MKMKDKTKDTDALTVEDGKQVVIEAWTRAEAKKTIDGLRKQAEEKGLDTEGGFIAYDYEKADMDKKPFSATLKFNDPKSI